MHAHTGTHFFVVIYLVSDTEACSTKVQKVQKRPQKFTLSEMRKIIYTTKSHFIRQEY